MEKKTTCWFVIPLPFKLNTEYLHTAIEYLKGVGTKRAEILKAEYKIFRFGDLLHYFPFRYIDKSKIYKIRDVNSDVAAIQLKGKLVSVEEIAGRGNKNRIHAIFSDGTGTVDLVWFSGLKWIKNSLKPETEYLVYGKPSFFNHRISITHPEMQVVENAEETDFGGLQPVYNATEKAKKFALDTKGIAKLTKTLLENNTTPFEEVLPEEVIDSLKLLSRNESLRNIHYPKDTKILERAIARLKFEELFFIQLQLLLLKTNRKKEFSGFVFEKIDQQFDTFFHQFMPFPLTEAQKRVVRDIRRDVLSGKQMNRLVQGDVGSGKTIVALLAMLMAVDNQFQATLLAPTEILAQQHFEGLSKLTEKLPINVRILTGSTKKAERTEILEKLQTGEIHILIGTHAILEETVVFNNLGIAVVDEQHRFGVAQRAKLWTKNKKDQQLFVPHILIMTATPIPRTLAMTLYGDLETSVIDELPPGRKPISTHHFSEISKQKAFDLIENEIKKGRQAYIVFPLIEESETLDYKNLMDGYEDIRSRFPQFAVSIVHGKMKSENKDFEMQRFVKGETQIMVATTVIEVGVNVPNASVMMIENAEKFGLAQLHQLRGRVGRGAEQSYCLLVTASKLSKEGRTRIETMVRTNDGFEIAEVDLKMRGPGDIKGTQQSGMLDLKIADLAKDQIILTNARNFAKEILTEDPNLALPKNAMLRKAAEKLKKNSNNWSRIS